MAIRSHQSVTLHESNPSEPSTKKPKRTLGDCTNIDFKHRRTSSRVNRSPVRRNPSFKDGRLSIDVEILADIQRFQDGQFPFQRRAMYNAQQTPLIPLITDLDFSLLAKAVAESNALLTLLYQSNDEYSSFQ